MKLKLYEPCSIATLFKIGEVINELTNSMVSGTRRMEPKRILKNYKRHLYIPRIFNEKFHCITVYNNIMQNRYN